MHVIMGGTGKVGSATAAKLLSQGEAVTIVTRDPDRASGWRAKGAKLVQADVEDISSLRAAFQQARRAFLLNPPADTSRDTNVVERRTVGNILQALDGSGLEKVVAESTGSAQPGERIGDLNVLWELEEGLRAQSIPAAINRAGYYMSNWDGLLDTARATGKLPTMLPADVAIPMVAPDDLGRVAAESRLASLAARTRKRDASGDSRGFSGAFMGFRSGLLLPRRATSACGATTAMHPHKRFGGVNGDGFWGDADGAAAIEQGGY